MNETFFCFVFRIRSAIECSSGLPEVLNQSDLNSLNESQFIYFGCKISCFGQATELSTIIYDYYCS